MPSIKQAVRDLAGRVPMLDRAARMLKTQREAFTTHYSSPIPSDRDIAGRLALQRAVPQLGGIELNHDMQHKTVLQYADTYVDTPFAKLGAGQLRYSPDQPWFSVSDAIFLYGFLRQHQPKNIIEVGCGYSSAAILDTIEACFRTRPSITFIEPFPQRLKGVLRGSDLASAPLIEQPVQQVPLDVFAALGAGDLLLIDSSHVLKCGSDVQFLLFDVLPALAPGVHVHFHDVYYPFEYPQDWLLGGRYWNEAYALRAFLSFNACWRIQLFNHYATLAFRDILEQRMPLCLNSPTSSIYIERMREA